MDVLIYIYIFCLTFLLVYSFYTLYLAMCFKRGYLDQTQTELPLLAEGHYPMVTIQLPIFNEKYVVERLVRKLSMLDYPKDRFEIQILDDSTDETATICATLTAEMSGLGFDICHIHRQTRDGYKAGALKASLDRAKGEYVAIFDADFLPKADFLRRTLPYFSDPKTGLVQTRWEHLNEDYSILTRVQAMALDGHFVVEQTARYLNGYFMNFNGTAGIWRKSTIIDAGNWQSDTITEDLDLSFRAQLKGWKFIYLTNYTTPAELPAEMNALKSQQYRWTKGAIETAKKLLPMIWRSPIGIRTKIHCTYHLTNNLVYLAILGVAILNLPLIYIKTNLDEFTIYFMFMSIFSLSFIGPFLLYYFAQRGAYQNWKERMMSFPVFLSGSMGLTLNNAKAVFDGLFGKHTGFIRTPKFNIFNKKDGFFDKSYKARMNPVIYAEILMTIYSFISFAMTVYYMELAAIPFHFMFFFGFLLISFLTIKHHMEYRVSRPAATVGIPSHVND